MSNNTLKIVNHRAKFLSEAFGMDQKDFRKLGEAMHEFFENQMEADNISPSKSEIFEAFIMSDEFVAVGLIPESANDFFMLGYIFAGLLGHLSDKERVPDEIKQLLIRELIDKRDAPKKKEKKSVN